MASEALALRARLAVPVDLRRWAPASALALATALALILLGPGGFAATDYELEAAEAFWALRTWDLERFLELVPSYGGSFVLRAPFAWVPGLWDGGELAVFRAVSVPGVLACSALAIFVVGRMRAAGRSVGAQVLVVVLLTFTPLHFRVLEVGHPEEFVGAVLCIAAVLAAPRRPVLAAVLLGLAVANKPWALVAVPAVLVTVPRSAVPRVAVVSGAVALVILAPLILFGGAFVANTAGATTTGEIFHPWQVFYLFGEVTSRELPGEAFAQDTRMAVASVLPLTRPLILGVPFVLAGIWWLRSRGRTHGRDALLLLALGMHIRCLLDPWNNEYYAVPALFALLIWECLERPNRAPRASLLFFLAHAVTFYLVRVFASPDANSVVYLAWAVPLAGWMAVSLWRVPLRRQIPDERARPAPVASPEMAST